MKNKIVIVESPGRINLIGEHIDYNGGSVLPAAINKKIFFEFVNLSHSDCYIESVTLQQSFKLNLESLFKSDNHWENYIIGVLINLTEKRNFLINGFKCLINSDLPIGAGISSSSSLICGFIKGIDHLNNLNLSIEDIIDIARDVEHNFIGLTGGIMDQFTILNGKEDKVLFLNCKTRDFTYIDSKFDPYKFLLLNTNVEHKLFESSYNERVNECNQVLDFVKKTHNEYNFLTELDITILNKFRSSINLKEYNRALYVIQENERTFDSVKYIKKLNFKAFGSLMYDSHDGLKNLYDVSCK
jgi:galactokinase